MVRIKSEIRCRSANQPFSEPFPTAALLLLILLIPSVGPSGVIRFTREGHLGGRARLLPSWRRIGSAGASPHPPGQCIGWKKSKRTCLQRWNEAPAELKAAYARTRCVPGARPRIGSAAVSNAIEFQQIPISFCIMAGPLSYRQKYSST